MPAADAQRDPLSEAKARQHFQHIALAPVILCPKLGRQGGLRVLQPRDSFNAEALRDTISPVALELPTLRAGLQDHPVVWCMGVIRRHRAGPRVHDSCRRDWSALKARDPHFSGNGLVEDTRCQDASGTHTAEPPERLHVLQWLEAKMFPGCRDLFRRLTLIEAAEACGSSGQKPSRQAALGARISPFFLNVSRGKILPL